MFQPELTGQPYDREPALKTKSFAEILADHILPSLTSERARQTLLSYAGRLTLTFKSEQGVDSTWVGSTRVDTDNWLSHDVDGFFLAYLEHKAITDSSITDLLHLLKGPKHFVDRINEQKANCLDLSLGCILAHYLQNTRLDLNNSLPLTNENCYLLSFNVQGEKFLLMETAKSVAKNVLGREYKSHYGVAYTKHNNDTLSWHLRTRYGSYAVTDIQIFLQKLNGDGEKTSLRTKREFIDQFAALVPAQTPWNEVEQFLAGLDRFPQQLIEQFFIEATLVRKFDSPQEFWQAVIDSSNKKLPEQLAEFLYVSLANALAMHRSWKKLSPQDVAALSR